MPLLVLGLIGGGVAGVSLSGGLQSIWKLLAAAAALYGLVKWGE